MIEYSGANSTALRREARRRKILENSANRLKLIEGVNSSFKNSTSTCLEPKQESQISVEESGNIRDSLSNESIHKPFVNSKLSEILKQSKELKEFSDLLQRKDVEDDDGVKVVEEEEEGREVFEEGEQDNIKCYFLCLCEKRLHYVLLALLVNVLLYVNLGYLFYENIFCPFYTLKAIELIALREEQKDIQPILFLFLSVIPINLQKVVRVSLSVIVSLFSDLFLYIFTFVIGTKIINLQV